MNVPPEDCLPLAAEFCEKVLQPIRDKWGPLFITSGYRCAMLNALVSKQPASQHVWTPTHCAADFQVRGVELETVFDWMRLESGLPFDELILERGKVIDSELDDCIHVSYVKAPRRIAKKGETNSASGFTRVEVA